SAPGMKLAQRAFRCVVHNQEGNVILHAEVQDAYNVRVPEVSNGLSFGDKACHIVLSELRMQDFNGGLCFQVEVFTEVDIGEAPLSKQANEAIVAQLLSYAINSSHGRPPLV